MMYFRICECCGAHLDPCEPCSCGESVDVQGNSNQTEDCDD